MDWEADQRVAAWVELDPNFEVEASLQSAKYLPDTSATLGWVAT